MDSLKVFAGDEKMVAFYGDLLVVFPELSYSPPIRSLIMLALMRRSQLPRLLTFLAVTFFCSEETAEIGPILSLQGDFPPRLEG